MCEFVSVWFSILQFALSHSLSIYSHDIFPIFLKPVVIRNGNPAAAILTVFAASFHLIPGEETEQRTQNHAQTHQFYLQWLRGCVISFRLASASVFNCTATPWRIPQTTFIFRNMSSMLFVEHSMDAKAMSSFCFCFFGCFGNFPLEIMRCNYFFSISFFSVVNSKESTIVCLFLSRASWMRAMDAYWIHWSKIMALFLIFDPFRCVNSLSMRRRNEKHVAILGKITKKPNVPSMQ